MTLALQALAIVAIWTAALIGLCALAAWNLSRVRMAAEKRDCDARGNKNRSDGGTE